MSYSQWLEHQEGYIYGINDRFLNKATNDLLVYYINTYRKQKNAYIRGMVSAAVMILRGRKEQEEFASVKTKTVSH